jgi:hypothetical protein
MYEYENDDEVMLECTLYYDYTKKYKPVKIVEVIKDKSIHELDQLLIHYMLLYGEDNVRGGNFYEEVLPDYKKKMLQELLEFNSIDYLTNINPIRKLICKYQNINVQEIPEKIESLNKTLEKYKKEFENLEKFRYINDETKNYRIDSSIFIDIEQLRLMCNNATDSSVVSPENKKTYKRIIALLKRLTELYSSLNDSLEHNQEQLVYLKNPEFLFDKFIYHIQNQNIHENEIEMVNTICDKFRYISCFILNRLDEFLFDVYESYGYNCNTDWIIPKEIYYLNHLLEKNQTPEKENGKNPEVELGL